MKLLSAICALILCTLIGYILAQKFDKRYKFYSNFESFNKQVKNEVYFSQKTLIGILGCLDLEEDFNKIAFEHFNSKKIAFNYRYLTKEDEKFLLSYFNALGDSDRETQINFINLNQNEISDRVKNCLEERKKYYQLYIKLGFLIGLIAFIVLI